MEEVKERVPLDTLTALYIKIRDKRSANKKMFEAEDKDLEEQMQVLSQEMLDVCKDMNADSIRTPDLYPKGLNVESEYTVVVRRSKES